MQTELKNCQKDAQNEEPPMHTIGQFLGVLFLGHSLPRRSDSAPLLRTHILTCFSLSHDFTQLLHYCPRHSHSQLIQMIIGICSGVPEAFEVFRCRPSTTESELMLFLKKVARHSLRSIVLEVNKLPFKLQEVGTVWNLLCLSVFCSYCIIPRLRPSKFHAMQLQRRSLHFSTPTQSFSQQYDNYYNRKSDKKT